MPFINAFSMQTMSNDCPDRKIARDNPSNNCAKLKLIPCPSWYWYHCYSGFAGRAWGKVTMIIEVPGSAPYPSTLATGNRGHALSECAHLRR